MFTDGSGCIVRNSEKDLVGTDKGKAACPFGVLLEESRLFPRKKVPAAIFRETEGDPNQLAQADHHLTWQEHSSEVESREH